MVVDILRVFVNEEGKFGNPVGIVVDEKQELSPADRQAIATKLGFSESVFINELNNGVINIFNPQREVNFAGHALVGTAYFISHILKKPACSLESNGGHIITWQENDQTWIHANLANTPPWRHEQLGDVSSVENLSISPTRLKGHIMVWAWTDKNKGLIRARTFAPDWGIPEDEANGSGSMQLAATLNQKLEIHHGKGSIIYAKPAKAGFAAVGGKVAQDKSQEVVIK